MPAWSVLRCWCVVVGGVGVVWFGFCVVLSVWCVFFVVGVFVVSVSLLSVVVWFVGGGGCVSFSVLVSGVSWCCVVRVLCDSL